jgi:eukaryotic-like serine/threonine-protein kinase
VSDSFETEKTQVTDPAVMRAKARVGQVLKNKWHLDVLLGVGGMAAVYAATHRNGSRAAVKLLHPELSTNGLVRARFLREGYVANAVGHDGAVKVIDDDEAEDDSLYLVTELLDGETLEDRRLRHGGCLDVGEVLCLTDRILDVLAAAHAKGIVHRDIKPDNVFITRAGQVKVIDFGIARLREARATKSATRSGAAMGTPAFMPPEQARGLWDEVDARSDIWALGATMVNLLTSRLLHEARSVNEQMMYSMTKKSPSLESMLPGAHPEVCRIVNRALAFDKNRRWRDARRMQDAVRGAYYSLYGRPIDGAPRMSVPDSVPNRTLSGSKTPTPVPREQTTARPVESISRNAPTVARPRRSRLSAAALIAGAAALGVALTAAVWMVTASSRQDAAAPASVPVRVAESPALAMDPSASAPAPQSSPTTLAPATSGLPIFTLPPLPSAGVFGRAATPAAAATHTPAAAASHTRPATAASVMPVLPPSPYPPPVVLPPSPYPPPSPYRVVSCNPPFVVDHATGQKHFKIECL